MYKNILKITLSLCLSVTFISCNNLLELEPEDALSDEKIFSSLSNFEKAVLGCYSTYHPEYNLLIGSIMADECKLDAQNNGVNGFGNLLQRWSYSSEDDIIYNTWKDNYSTIYSINLLLEKADKVPVNTEAQKDKLESLIAELHGLRALIHFDLHRNFGDSDSGINGVTIPYITDTDINKKPQKLTLSEFYNNLWNDLKNAENIQQNQGYRLQNDAITALEARVALYQKNYTLASEKSSILIQSYQLENEERYNKIWNDNTNTEVIFQLKRTNDSSIRPNTIWQNYSTGRTYFRPSYKLMSSYEDTDIRLQNFSEEDNDYNINKYPGNDHSDRINDVKIFRISEMYLIRAEAHLFLRNTSQATQDINLLRIKRDKTAEPLTSISLSTILEERYRELSYEGHRYYDLKRLKQEITRDASDLFSPQDQSILNALDKAYILPIPLKESIINPNL